MADEKPILVLSDLPVMFYGVCADGPLSGLTWEFKDVAQVDACDRKVFANKGRMVDAQGRAVEVPAVYLPIGRISVNVGDLPVWVVLFRDEDGDLTVAPGQLATDARPFIDKIVVEVAAKLSTVIERLKAKGEVVGCEPN